MLQRSACLPIIENHQTSHSFFSNPDQGILRGSCIHAYWTRVVILLPLHGPKCAVYNLILHIPLSIHQLKPNLCWHPHKYFYHNVSHTMMANNHLLWYLYRTNLLFHVYWTFVPLPRFPGLKMIVMPQWITTLTTLYRHSASFCRQLYISLFTLVHSRSYIATICSFYIDSIPIVSQLLHPCSDIALASIYNHVYITYFI